MKFAIVAEFEIIEEDCKEANCSAICFPVCEIYVNQKFTVNFDQISDVSENKLFDSILFNPRFVDSLIFAFNV